MVIFNRTGEKLQISLTGHSKKKKKRFTSFVNWTAEEIAHYVNWTAEEIAVFVNWTAVKVANFVSRALKKNRQMA